MGCPNSCGYGGSLSLASRPDCLPWLWWLHHGTVCFFHQSRRHWSWCCTSRTRCLPVSACCRRRRYHPVRHERGSLIHVTSSVPAVGAGGPATFIAFGRLSRHGGQLFYYRSGSVRSECRHALASLIGDGFIALAVSDISMPFSEACCRSRLPFLTWRRAAHLKLATERRLEQFGREFIGRN